MSEPIIKHFSETKRKYKPRTFVYVAYIMNKKQCEYKLVSCSEEALENELNTNPIQEPYYIIRNIDFRPNELAEAYQEVITETY